MKYLRFSLLLNALTYLVVAFVAWDIFWIANAGTWDALVRIGIIFLFGMKEVFARIAYEDFI